MTIETFKPDAMNRCHETSFGFLPVGSVVSRYSFTNRNGIRGDILNYGGILQTLLVPNRAGNVIDVVLGYDDLAGYLNDKFYMGALIGRYANRIGGGNFRLNGKQIRLMQNDGQNTLHGGRQGLDQVLWNSKIILFDDQPMLELTHTSPDGDQGFPGELYITVHISLNDNDELQLELRAATDRQTVINLSAHPYFNLSDLPGSTIDGHELMINSDQCLKINGTMIPTGSPIHVADTPFDFSQPTPLGKRIDQTDPQLQLGRGYDHCYVFKSDYKQITTMAELSEPISGRKMEILSNAPGMQLYSGNYLNDSVTGKGDRSFKFRQAVCLEPQNFPNAPNTPAYPSAVLAPGEEYIHKIIYRFDLVD